jgi:putative oxidoreductase
MNALALAPFRTLSGYAATVLRVVLGIIFIAHGKAKLDGGMEGTAGFFGSVGVPLPDLMAPLITALEIGGGLLLIIGLGTRIVALLFALEMIGTTLLVRVPLGLIAEQGVGAEFDLAMLAGSLAILFLGPGKLAVDNKIGLGP